MPEKPRGNIRRFSDVVAALFAQEVHTLNFVIIKFFDSKADSLFHCSDWLLVRVATPRKCGT
jgi:hypothetical protein